MATDMQLTIPMPLQIIVDDVGWWSGQDGSQFNQPYRTGIGRDHQPEDYLALAALGKGLGMKILAGFVLCEWDKANLLRKLPSSTWMGEDWNNAGIRPAHKERAADILRRSQANIEIGLHGIGHELWVDGRMQRAEFHNQHCEMRDKDEIRRHLDFFLQLMEQYKLSPAPVSFIPPALKHSFGNGEEGFQKLLEEFGIRYVATHFDKARQFSAPLHPQLTWENNVLLVDREKAESAWNATACEPAFAFDRPFLTLHWANILHHDPAKNLDVVRRWIDFIREGSKKQRILLARDTQSCLSQYLHRMFSTVHEQNGEFSIDLTWKNDLPRHLIDHSFFVELTPSPITDFKIYGADAECIRNTVGSTIFQITPQSGLTKILLGPGQEM
ncbi:MAG: hypothetical protein Q8R88_16925 [Desulfoprunum sp.]|nr:hypothetical protein [Desulfoprunum sp.]